MGSTLGRLALSASVLMTACKPDRSSDVATDLHTPEVSSRKRPADAVERELAAKADDVLQRRCVLCHGCYDAPCQLKLDAPEGLSRGGSKQPVYDGARLSPAVPTRLGIDAHTPAQWRELGFHPVWQVDEAGATRSDSVILRMLDLKRTHPAIDDKLLPETIPVGLGREQVCASAQEMDDFEADHPQWGMPYGLPPLGEEEQAVLEDWLADGAPIAASPELPDDVATQVEDWEVFLNGDDPRSRLMARYVYEHLFLATLVFEGDDTEVGFRLVRSRTKPGEPIDEIATRRPFDDPGVTRPHYRLQRRPGVRLSKTHMPYTLGPDRMKRWRKLFIEAVTSTATVPGYDLETASNPFVTYASIPVRSRYRFLLDDAEFMIMGFIKGPVCRGQVALDVIRDHFWVTFVDPDSPLVLAEDAFLRDVAGSLQLPSSEGSDGSVARWLGYARREKKFLKAKTKFLEQQVSEVGLPTLDIVWDGDGDNSNAGLTVFRHFDNATVTRGLLGPQPQTAWLLSYAVFERIHYLLVAGFDVFGDVGHQADARLYMDFLRMEAEHNFLLLLPKSVRRDKVDDWYQDVRRRVKKEVYGQTAGFRFDTGIAYQTDDPQAELLHEIRARLEPVLVDDYDLRHVRDLELRSALQAIESVQGRPSSLLPEHAHLYVPDAPEGSRHYTMLRHSMHTNVAHLFREDKRRLPERDYVTVLPGFLGAYPNAMFVVERAELGRFAKTAAALDGPAAYEALVDDFGVRRTDLRFWDHSDTLHDARQSLEGPEAGLLDYNRLENR